MVRIYLKVEHLAGRTPYLVVVVAVVEAVVVAVVVAETCQNLA